MASGALWARPPSHRTSCCAWRMRSGRVLKRSEAHPTVLIGKDTRISGYMLESALESGFNSAGVDVVLLGPLPPPGVLPI